MFTKKSEESKYPCFLSFETQLEHKTFVSQQKQKKENETHSTEKGGIRLEAAPIT